MWVLPVIILLSFIAGIYQKLVSVSISILVIPGVLGFSNLIPIDANTFLLVMLASCLFASLPFCLYACIQAVRRQGEHVALISKSVMWMSLMAILISQLLGIVPGGYVNALYWLVVGLFASGLMFRVAIHQKKLDRLGVVAYAGLLSICVGGSGGEWRNMFLSHLKSKLDVDRYLISGLFIALSACLGFLFPALPVLIDEQFAWASLWMLGYICWPLSLVISVSSLLGYLVVRNHQNQTDQLWLTYILALYLIASFLRWLAGVT